LRRSPLDILQPLRRRTCWCRLSYGEGQPRGSSFGANHFRMPSHSGFRRKTAAVAPIDLSNNSAMIPRVAKARLLAIPCNYATSSHQKLAITTLGSWRRPLLAFCRLGADRAGLRPESAAAKRATSPSTGGFTITCQIQSFRWHEAHGCADRGTCAQGKLTKAAAGN
jgi:hypothetical protein